MKFIRTSLSALLVVLSPVLAGAGTFTVGYTTIPIAAVYSPGETDCESSSFDTPGSGTIQSLSMYFPTGNTATAGAFLGIYGDTAGVPGPLIATTASFTLPTVAGWTTLTTTTHPLVKGGSRIYLCWAEPAGSTMKIENDADATNTTWYDTGVHTLPATFAVGGSFTNQKPGFYATFNTPGSGGPKAPFIR